MNKKLVISLFAGALLLPASAAFAAVSGVCDDCHTMHTSQNATSGGATPQGFLLGAQDCAGCHAYSTSNDAAGLGTGTVAAPQVIATTNTNAAGYFVNGALATAALNAAQHNIFDLGNPQDTNMTAGADQNQPGGLAAAVTGGAGTGLGDGTDPALACTSCHTQSGHHAGGTNYRLLSGAQTTSGAAIYGTAGTRDNGTYDAVGMNNFCATCHANFHGTANTGAASPFIRHPTSVRTSTAAGASIVTPAQSAVVLLGAAADGTNEDYVMCITCHMPHGNANADMLSFVYGDNSAGDGTADVGCESCHSYTATGM